MCLYAVNNLLETLKLKFISRNRKKIFVLLNRLWCFWKIWLGDVLIQIFKLWLSCCFAGTRIIWVPVRIWIKFRIISLSILPNITVPTVEYQPTFKSKRTYTPIILYTLIDTQITLVQFYQTLGRVICFFAILIKSENSII